MTVDELIETSDRYTANGVRDYGYVTRNDLSCKEYRGGYVTPRAYYPDRSFVGAVYDGNGALVRSTLRFNQNDIVPADPAFIDDVALLSASRSGNAIYGGILFPILGHFLFESIARLWPLLWSAAGKGSGIPIYFHPWPGLNIGTFFENPFYRQCFAALGVAAEDVRVVSGCERFDTLVVPDPASAYHLNLDERMVAIFDRIAADMLKHRPPPASPASRAIYLSRSRWTENRRLVNEEAVEQLMIQRGFQIMHTEELSPDTLIATLVEADLVVSTDGSHAHLLMFCNPGTRVVMLDTRPVPTQFAIAVLKGFRCRHLPLFETGLYVPGNLIGDVPLLGSVIDHLLARL